MMTARFNGKSFKSILDLNNGAGMGFDILRLSLALLVLISHCSHLASHSGTTELFVRWLHGLMNIFVSPAGAQTPSLAADVVGTVSAAVGAGDPTPNNGLKGASGPFIRALIPMFFALSGFLVAGSAVRTKGLMRFLGLRTLRILPALFVEVTLSAILLGAVFTTLPLKEYYTHPMFFSYFLNIFGIVHFFLPGVFQDAATPAVNANLWTIPFELECYLLMSALILLGLLRNRVLFTILFAVATIGLIIVNTFYGYMSDVSVYPGRALVYCFGVGVLFYLWRDRIIFNWLLFLVSGVASYLLLLYPGTVFIAPIFLTYITVFIGLLPLPQFSLVKSGDYSYGIYLYGYPITQAIVAVVGRDTVPYPVLVLLIVSMTGLLAVFSWHGVEKHVLKLKRYLSKPSAKITAELHPDMASAANESKTDQPYQPQSVKPE